MATMTIQLDLDRLGYTEQQVLDFIKDSPYEYVKDYWAGLMENSYKYEIQDITKGWQVIGNVRDWTSNDGPFESGVYALVFDPSGRVQHPITQASTFIIGETQQDGYKRIQTHTLALRGKTSNMSDKYRKHLPKINQWAGEPITKRLDKIKIFFRPHSVDNVEDRWISSRTHSLYMEKLCMGSYYACWGHFPVGNTRDLPVSEVVDKCRVFLEGRGYNLD